MKKRWVTADIPEFDRGFTISLAPLVLVKFDTYNSSMFAEVSPKVASGGACWKVTDSYTQLLPGIPLIVIGLTIGARCIWEVRHAIDRPR